MVGRKASEHIHVNLARADTCKGASRGGGTLNFEVESTPLNQGMSSNSNVTTSQSTDGTVLGLPASNAVNGKHAHGFDTAAEHVNGAMTSNEVIANSEDPAPGPFISSRMDYWVTKKDRPEVTPDKEAILSAAWNNSGGGVVRNHHIAKFNAIWGDLETVLQHVHKDISATREGLSQKWCQLGQLGKNGTLPLSYRPSLTRRRYLG